MDPQKAEVSDLPAVPKVKLADVLIDGSTVISLLRRKLQQELTEDLASYLANGIAEALEHGATPNIFETLLQYRGQIIDSRFCSTIGMQFAARQEELYKGFLLKFDRPLKKEWVAIEIVDIVETPWISRRGTEGGAELFMVALTGHPAGHPLRRKFPLRWLNGFAYKLGFSRRTPYDQEIRHFVRMHFWGYLAPQEGNEIVFEDVAIPSRELKHNKHIIKLRTRFDYEKAECHLNHQHLCWECPESRKTCSASIVKAAAK